MPRKKNNGVTNLQATIDSLNGQVQSLTRLIEELRKENQALKEQGQPRMGGPAAATEQTKAERTKPVQKPAQKPLRLREEDWEVPIREPDKLRGGENGGPGAGGRGWVARDGVRATV